jgi:hypothetical protein
VDKAGAEGLVGLKDASGEGPLEGAALADGAGEAAEEDDGEHADAHFGKAEARAHGGDDAMAVGEEADAARERGPLDGGDDGLGEAGADGKEPFVGRVGVGIFVEVDAGTEDLAFGVEQQDGRGGVLFGLVQGAEEGVAQFPVERVGFLGAGKG